MDETVGTLANATSPARYLSMVRGEWAKWCFTSSHLSPSRRPYNDEPGREGTGLTKNEDRSAPDQKNGHESKRTFQARFRYWCPLAVGPVSRCRYPSAVGPVSLFSVYSTMMFFLIPPLPPRVHSPASIVVGRLFLRRNCFSSVAGTVHPGMCLWYASLPSPNGGTVLDEAG